MTPKEALQETYRRKEIAEMTAENEVVEYYNAVVEALEKQIPKKPSTDGIMMYCPICGTPICFNEFVETLSHDYCLNCGQSIDWTEDGEHGQEHDLS